MNILMCVFQIQDLGGIINHAEHLIHGLKQLGHDVTLVRIEDKEKLISSKTSRPLTTGTYSGIPLDQRAGWAFPIDNRIPFRSTNWKKYTSKYDLVLWEVPFPPKDFENPNKLYNISTPQIPFIHDGNLVKMYPDLVKQDRHFEFYACVHDCAVGNVRELVGDDYARLILNPQVLHRGRMEKPDFKSRKRSLCSFQTFKAWKHVDDLVGAVPYIHSDGVMLGGGGIEYYYMTSKDKRKPKYGKIWENAVKYGMKYVGYVDEPRRDIILLGSRLLIDSSWSKRYGSYGSHFNRIMVDAIVKGCIPVLRDLAMKDNSVFKKNRHYIETNFDGTPLEYAHDINEALNMDPGVADKMIRSAQKIVKKRFDSVEVAKELLL